MSIRLFSLEKPNPYFIKCSNYSRGVQLEGSESTQPQKVRRRKRIGKIMLYIGIILFVSIIMLELGVMLVYAYNGSSSLIHATNDVALLTVPMSLILILIGLSLVLMPDGFTSDGIWIFNVGPFNK